MAGVALFGGVLVLAWAGAAEGPTVWFQAHRGGLLEAPENTMAAFRHAWSCPGAIPEVDVRATKDGVMVCLHDDTPGRTTNAPQPYKNMNVSGITFDQLRQWDASVTFAVRSEAHLRNDTIGHGYAEEKVPSLTEVFGEMKGRPERQVYLDVKGVDFDKLAAAVTEYGLNNQVIFVHGNHEGCIDLSKLFPGARTMTWLSGTPSQIKRRFEDLSKNGFEGISQLQFHLETKGTGGRIVYVLDNHFLRYALKTTKGAGVDLQLRPFDFDAASLRGLINLGVQWYVADEPRRFADTVATVRSEDSRRKTP